jgi:hypothetical protein
VTRQSGRAEAGYARQVEGFAGGRGSSSDAVRAELAGRLRRRCHEIEKVVLARVRRLADLDDGDSVQIADLRQAVAAAVSYGIEGIEKGVGWPALTPPAAARHARRAAEEGISLDLVLRHYTAGNKVLEEFVVAEGEGVSRQVLCQILSDQAPRVDRLLEFVASEYQDEYEQSHRSSSQTRTDQIVRLVQDDGPAGSIDLDYEFDAWHIGLIMRGSRADLAVRTCAERLGYRLLHAIHGSETVWAWLSSSRPPDAAKVEGCLAKSMPPQLSAAMGEPRRELDGWRLSHREAHMALQVMLQSGQRFVRAREVVLHFAVMRDDTIVRTLVDSYLGPLKGHRSAQALLEALRAYLASGGNAAAAAASLGVARHTVHRRIRTVEEMLGRPLNSCLAELQIALRVDELEAAQGS